MAPESTLRELQERLAPVTLSREQLLTVPEPLAPLFPFEGLQRGLSVGFDGPGGSSVALALAAAALGDDRWMAIVGVEELGLLAASEIGVRLDRLLLIESTASVQLAPVVAALVEAVDIIILNPRKKVGAREARRLNARARERGTVLFHLDGGRSWPEALHLNITAKSETWEGLGQGHGHLKQRHLSVTATGRRASARPRHVSVLLPGPNGAVTKVPGSAGGPPAQNESGDELLFARAG